MGCRPQGLRQAFDRLVIGQAGGHYRTMGCRRPLAARGDATRYHYAEATQATRKNLASHRSLDPETVLDGPENCVQFFGKRGGGQFGAVAQFDSNLKLDGHFRPGLQRQLGIIESV